jgi:hypothetical protein
MESRTLGVNDDGKLGVVDMLRYDDEPEYSNRMLRVAVTSSIQIGGCEVTSMAMATFGLVKKLHTVLRNPNRDGMCPNPLAEYQPLCFCRQCVCVQLVL